MSVIDDYLADMDPAKRDELRRIRTIAKAIVPDAVEAITYGMPTLTYRGRAILGFDGRKNHVGIYPFSGRVLREIPELARYAQSKGALREDLDDLLPAELIEKIVRERLSQLKEAD